MDSQSGDIAEGDEEDPGLGVAQIVITAATPMEEVEHPFPGSEAGDNKETKAAEKEAEKEIEITEVGEEEEEQEHTTEDEQTEVRQPFSLTRYSHCFERRLMTY